MVPERKLQPNEFPHNLYIQNYSTATATCIALRKWLFSIEKEKDLSTDDIAVRFFYSQASITSSDCISYFHPRSW